MPTPIDRERLGQLIKEGAQLVEVLPRAEYEEEHLPGAISISLKELGRIGRSAIRAREDVSAEEAMTPGPSTIRPNARLRDVVERIRRQNLGSLPVTTSDGRLTGLLTRSDAEGAPGHARRPIVATVQRRISATLWVVEDRPPLVASLMSPHRSVEQARESSHIDMF